MENHRRDLWRPISRFGLIKSWADAGRCLVVFGRFLDAARPSFVPLPSFLSTVLR